MTKSTQSVFKAIVKWKRQVVGQVVQEGTAAALPARTAAAGPVSQLGRGPAAQRVL